MADLIGARSKSEVKDLFAHHISPGKIRFFEGAGIDFVLGRREGAFLWDLEGKKRLIDCHCNGGVFNLGHRNAEVISALQASLAELDIGNHHLLSEQRAALAESLARVTPGSMPYTVFGVSGGEAIDLAIKIARGFTRRPRLVSALGGYHGHTGLALAAGDPKYYAPFGAQAPGFSQVPFNDLAALDQVLNDEVAAVLLETVPATNGIFVPDPGYFQEVRRLCDRAGALLIQDEVQTGLGRTGQFWGIQHYGVVPDILVTGKGLSGGIFPITATCFTEKLVSVFDPDPFIHISTFGGAEVGCPAALKVLEITSAPGFLQHVRAMAAFFAAAFAELKTRHSILTGLRQLGMMMGIELADPRLGPVFTRMAYECGFLAIYANHNPRVVQFLPPLTITQDLAVEIVERADQALTLVERLASSTVGRNGN